MQVAEKTQADDEEAPSTFVIPLRAQSLREAVDELTATQPGELSVLERFALSASRLSWSPLVQSENMLRSRLERVLTNALATAKEGNSAAAKYLLWLSSPVDVDAEGAPRFRRDWLQFITAVQEADVVCTTSMPRFLRNILDELKQQDEERHGALANRIITEYVMGYPSRQDVAEVCSTHSTCCHSSCARPPGGDCLRFWAADLVSAYRTLYSLRVPTAWSWRQTRPWQQKSRI